jgi:hypothetical protein
LKTTYYVYVYVYVSFSCAVAATLPSATRADIQSYFAACSPRLVRLLGKAAGGSGSSSSSSGGAADARVTTAVLGVHRALCLLVQVWRRAVPCGML